MVDSRPTVRRRRLATILIKYREEAGKSIDDAAARIGCHRTKINRIENARLGISVGELRDLMGFYGVGDAELVEEMISLARQGRAPGWVRRASKARPSYSDLIGYEETTNYIRSYEQTLITGLLQTPEYARAVINAAQAALEDDEVEALVTARMERQKFLGGHKSPRLHVIQGEAALRLQVGGPEVMGQQLDHLAFIALRPWIDLQIIPDRAGAHAGLYGSFVIYGFPHPAFSDVVCVEHRTGTLYMETPEEIEEYTLVFDSLRSIALSPSDSLDLVAEIRKGL
ncbi:helix-turn-helix transcriptional regulator [Streptomyces sp. NPDC003077]|uniref:helix-turn-helix domain-containing protein n=1 Tax=Streptomyces sp. NPDC003077 TaxID=3154443 RepID=UPI0033BA623E